MQSQFRQVLAAVTVGLAAFSAPLGAQVIDTRVGTSFSGATGLGPGDGDWAIGQTFTVPGGATSLLNASLLVSPYVAASASVVGNLRAWNGTAATGGALYTSAPVTIVSLTQALFNVGGLTVTPGTQYVFYLTSPTGGELVYANSPVSNSYAGGTGVLQTTPGGAWSDARVDYAFTATFASTTATPEPSTWALTASGLLTIGGAAVRRRRARTH